MNIFLDAKALLKIYIPNNITTFALHSIYQTSTIYLPEIASIAFRNNIWQQVRTEQLHTLTAIRAIENFELAAQHFIWLPTEDAILQSANQLTMQYSLLHSLDSLDAIQLATALTLHQENTKFLIGNSILYKILSDHEFDLLGFHNLSSILAIAN